MKIKVLSLKMLMVIKTNKFKKISIGPRTKDIQGHERYADCFCKEFLENKNPIKAKMLNDRVYRF